MKRKPVHKLKGLNMSNVLHLSILNYNTGAATGMKLTAHAARVSYVADGVSYDKAPGTAMLSIRGDASHPLWHVNADAAAIAAAAGGMYQITMYGMPTFKPWIKLDAITAIYPARYDNPAMPADLIFIVGDGFTPVGVHMDDVPALVAAMGTIVVL